MGKSSYPSLFDSDVELPRVEDNVTEIGGEAINSLRDAIFSIESAIGLNPQGNTADLVTRINVSIDDNGYIKTSALSKRGLVTLPIVNAHISSNAGIEEVKLDLDYPTADLYGRILSNITDINAIRTAFNAFVAQTVNHFSGVGNRHDGYHIDLTQPIRSSEDVETIINVLNNAFTAHEQSTAGSHTAYGISSEDEFVNFSADNVQDALIELDRLNSTVTEGHQDRSHLTSVAMNRRGEQDPQGNRKETVLAGTIYKTESTKATNIFQVMRPNVARITSKDLDLRALAVGSAQNLRVQAGGIDRGPLDINLTAIIPAEDVDDVVDAINTAAQACEEHYPISAYNTGGKLTIAHTMPGKLYTVQILDSVQFSAATALGFGTVAGLEFEWSGTAHAGYAGGKIVTDLKPLVKRHHVHSTKPLNTMVLGLGDLSKYGLIIGNEGRTLVNIVNHTASSDANGTHYILGYPNDETIVLSSDIPLGEFDIEIVADSVNFENSANGEIYDIFVEADADGYGIVTKASRASYGPLSGVDLKAVSKDFPSLEWDITNASLLSLYDGNESGVTTTIPTGFQGELKVFAPDNVNSALFQVTGAPTSGRKSIAIIPFEDDDDKLHVASVHYAGNHGLTALKYTVDKRLLGGSVDNKSEDKLQPTLVEDVIGELRNNGIIRGFTVLENDETSFRLRGGRALVSGRVVEKDTMDIVLDDLSASKKLLLINKYGNYVIKSEFDSGFSFDELTSGDGYGDDRGVAVICEFETDGSKIDGYFTDRRLIVSKLDKKVLDIQTSLEQKITDLRGLVGGSSWGLTVAEASGNFNEDGYLASVEMGSNNGFTFIPGPYEDTLSARGFGGGSSLITTRRFEFSDPDTIQTSIFRPVGMSHINVFVEALYTGITPGKNGPFGVSGTVYIEVGVACERGLTSLTVTEEYARVKTINTGVLPNKEVIERYVASIPVSQLSLPENVMFDVVPRVRILNSNYVDGGPSADTEPTIRFNHIRIVTSSYSIAGSISGEDGTSSALGTTVGQIL